MLTGFHDLFAALVLQVPLLDMKRYSRLLAGASWLAEYGDPETDDWKLKNVLGRSSLADCARDSAGNLISSPTAALSAVHVFK